MKIKIEIRMKGKIAIRMYVVKELINEYSLSSKEVKSEHLKGYYDGLVSAYKREIEFLEELLKEVQDD